MKWYSVLQSLSYPEYDSPLVLGSQELSTMFKILSPSQFGIELRILVFPCIKILFHFLLKIKSPEGKVT